MKKLQIGDIGFTFKRGNIFSKLVYLVSVWKKNTKTSTKISHCFVYMGDGLIAESSFHGVGIFNLKKYGDKYDIYFKRVDKILTPQEQQTLWMHAAEQAGITKYSYVQLLSFLFGKIFNVTMKDYSKVDKVCSEFVSEAYRKIDVQFTTNNLPSNDTPLDIFESDKLVNV
jgi:hypothetical protein